MTQIQVCTWCSKEIVNEDPVYFDNGYTGIHEDCVSDIESDDRSSPQLTVYYSHNIDQPNSVGRYHDDTEGDFEPQYNSIDAWRGTISPISKNYTSIHNDGIKAFSPEEEDQEKFLEKTIDALDEEDIEYAVVYAASSNVFFTRQDIFIKNEDVDKAKKVLDEHSQNQ